CAQGGVENTPVYREAQGTALVRGSSETRLHGTRSPCARSIERAGTDGQGEFGVRFERNPVRIAGGRDEAAKELCVAWTEVERVRAVQRAGWERQIAAIRAAVGQGQAAEPDAQVVDA